MRVHFGFSFRLKNILKFLLPFVIGFLAYFGFNIIGVFADYKSEQKLNIVFNTNDYDLTQTIPGLNKSILETYQELKSLATQKGKNYFFTIETDENNILVLRCYFNTYTYSSGMAMSVQQVSPGSFDVWNVPNRNNSVTNFFRWFSNPLYLTQNSSNNQLYYNRILNYINNDNSSGMSQEYNLILYHLSSANFNDNVYTGNINNSLGGMFLLDTSIDFKYNTNNYNNADTYPLYINNEFVEPLTRIPTYFDIVALQNPQFNILLDKLPNIYFEIDTNNLSNFNGQLSYVPLIDAQTYIDLVGGGSRYFYGRKNNNNHYYSYERLNCTRSATFDITGNKITHNYSNINCTDNLDNYDRIYFTETYDYIYDQNNEYNHGVIGAFLSSNGNHYLNKDFKGHIYTKFNSNYNWKFLISSEIREDIYIKNSDKFMSFAFLDDKDTTHFELDVNNRPIGNSVYKFLFPDFMTFGFFKNTVFIYDDFESRGNTNGSYQEMLIPFPEYRIISIPYDINGVETFDYLNNNNTISSASINAQYNVDSDDTGSFDLSSIFNKINNFLNSINTDMVNTHNLLQYGFDELPLEIQIIINVVFALSCAYLVFREVRR